MPLQAKNNKLAQEKNCLTPTSALLTGGMRSNCSLTASTEKKAPQPPDVSTQRTCASGDSDGDARSRASSATAVSAGGAGADVDAARETDRAASAATRILADGGNGKKAARQRTGMG